MITNWSRSVPLLLDSEGAEVTLGGSEPGGASKYGVSVFALTDLRKSLGLGPATVDIVSQLTAEQAEDFYQRVTAQACRFDDLPVGVDYAMLDVTANLGPSGGPWLLQCVLGVWPHVSGVTDEMIRQCSTVDQGTLIYAIGAAWMAKKRESGAWPRAGHGWTNRMVRVRRDALAMTGENK